jgi:hypothetical protein
MISRLRSASLALGLALVAPVVLPACAGMMRSFTPGVLQQGAHAHAFQTASFAYAFMNGHAVQWDARLDRLEKDGVPFFEAVKRSKYVMLVDVVPHTHSGTGSEYEYYDLSLRLLPRRADGTVDAKGALTLTGVEGTAVETQKGEDARAAEALGIDAGAVQRGHMAVYGLVTMLAQLNASNDTLQRHAFALLVVREKVKNGERADWFDGTRSPEETREDIDLALRVVADHHAATAAWRSEIVAMTAMVQAYESTVAMDALRAQITDSRARATAWRAEHHQPTMDEYGVRAQALKLPTPDAMVAELDKSGYVRAAMEVAKGIATGSAGTTLGGLAKLAPKDSTLRTALDGVSAAMKGDFEATIDFVAKLAGKEADVGAVKARLAQIKAAVKDAKGGIAEVRAGVGKLGAGGMAP